jgi:hypothetical protein
VTPVILLFSIVAGPQGPSCGEGELSALVRAQERLASGDPRDARAVLEVGQPGCAARRIAALALRGWLEARRLAALGGPVDQQGAVRSTLAELRTLTTDPITALEVEYAETSILAAIAAAQDERPEMELLLTHARDLAERLSARDRRAVWPQPFNIVAGELWFEVDRYADALTAYERAVSADASPVARAGMARALARLNRVQEACAVLQRLGDAASPLRADIDKELARCP